MTVSIQCYSLALCLIVQDGPTNNLASWIPVKRLNPFFSKSPTHFVANSDKETYPVAQQMPLSAHSFNLCFFHWPFSYATMYLQIKMNLVTINNNKNSAQVKRTDGQRLKKKRSNQPVSDKTDS